MVMTIELYQKISSLYSSENDEITQVALIVSDLFGYSHKQVDEISPKKFIKLSTKVTKIFKILNKKPLFSKYKFITNAKEITLGQFIEVQHFLKEGEINAMHLVGASIWKSNKDHQLKASKLLKVNIRHILNDYTLFLISFSELLASYKGLFEQDQSELEEDAKIEKPHHFIEQFGWIYSAKQVAQHEGISLDKAFELPILQAFNTLAYLKSEQAYQKHISK